MAKRVASPLYPLVFLMQKGLTAYRYALAIEKIATSKAGSGTITAREGEAVKKKISRKHLGETSSRIVGRRRAG